MINFIPFFIDQALWRICYGVWHRKFFFLPWWPSLLGLWHFIHYDHYKGKRLTWNIFSTHECFSGIPPRERSKPFYDKSAHLLDLRNTSLTTIQACVLLGGISTTEDNAITESVYYTVACRMANLLDLSKKLGSDPLEREIGIRG